MGLSRVTSDVQNQDGLQQQEAVSQIDNLIKITKRYRHICSRDQCIPLSTVIFNIIGLASTLKIASLNWDLLRVSILAMAGTTLLMNLWNLKTNIDKKKKQIDKKVHDLVQLKLKIESNKEQPTCLLTPEEIINLMSVQNEAMRLDLIKKMDFSQTFFALSALTKLAESEFKTIIGQASPIKTESLDYWRSVYEKVPEVFSDLDNLKTYAELIVRSEREALTPSVVNNRRLPRNVFLERSPLS